MKLRISIRTGRTNGKNWAECNTYTDNYAISYPEEYFVPHIYLFKLNWESSKYFDIPTTSEWKGYEPPNNTSEQRLYTGTTTDTVTYCYLKNPIT